MTARRDAAIGTPRGRYGSRMTDTSGSSFGLGDLFGLLGGSNPLAGLGTTIAVFQKGVYEFLAAVENFNEAMVQLNGIAARVNRLLDDVEPPVRALLPQLTRTIRAADSMAEQLSVPVEMVAPGLSRLAEVLSSQSLVDLPSGLGETLDLLRDVAHRMQPLGQLAESAGGLFGLRPLAALRAGGGRPAAPPPPPPPTEAPSRRTPAPRPGAAAPATPRKAAAKRQSATRAAGSKAAAPGTSAPTTKRPAKRAASGTGTPAKRATKR